MFTDNTLRYFIETRTTCRETRGGAQNGNRNAQYAAVEAASCRLDTKRRDAASTDQSRISFSSNHVCFVRGHPAFTHQPFHQGDAGAAVGAGHKSLCVNKLHRQSTWCTRTERTEGRCVKRAGKSIGSRIRAISAKRRIPESILSSFWVDPVCVLGLFCLGPELQNPRKTRRKPRIRNPRKHSERNRMIGTTPPAL